MLALIPARGGSKGLPGKNIKNFDGIPLIAHTIRAAQNAKRITEVYVSTDCLDIASVARQYGAKILSMRPEHLAQDDSKGIDVYVNFIDEWEQKHSQILNEIVILLPTSPLREAKHIDEAISLYSQKYADSVISFTPETHPIKWHKYIKSDGCFENIFPETLENRQRERVSYYPNGAIYVFNSGLLKKGKYYSDNSYAYLMDNLYSVDIDTMADFEYALFLKRKNHHG